MSIRTKVLTTLDGWRFPVVLALGILTSYSVHSFWEGFRYVAVLAGLAGFFLYLTSQIFDDQKPIRGMILFVGFLWLALFALGLP